jgi:hypothetical protein
VNDPLSVPMFAPSRRQFIRSIGTQKVIITDQKRGENTKYANGRSRLDERPLSPGIEPVPPPQQPRGFQKLAQIAPGVSVVGSTAFATTSLFASKEPRPWMRPSGTALTIAIGPPARTHA